MVIRRLLRFHIILVELIVVLVILAILAAIMVPALTGWIDKAKERQDMIDARSAYLAAQTIASEMYATKSTLADADLNDTAVLKKITDLAEVAENSVSNITVGDKAKITGMKYKGKSKEYTYNNGWSFLS